MFWNKKEKEVTPDLLLINPLSGETKTVKDDDTYKVITLVEMKLYLDRGYLPHKEGESPYTMEFSVANYLMFLKGVDRLFGEKLPETSSIYISTVGAWIDGTIRELYPLLLEKENNHKT